jgi:putative hydrolase of the HAD superfamily
MDPRNARRLSASADPVRIRTFDQETVTNLMDIRAIAFDVNGTLVDIETDETRKSIFRAAGHFLTYQGIDLRRHAVRDLYFHILKEQKAASGEKHPEFDAVAIWRKIIADHMTDYTRRLPAEKLAHMPVFLAEMSRGISRRRLHTYPHVYEVLDGLRQRFRLAIVTDAQSAFARAELNKVGLLDYFNPIIISGDFGYRKPDRRLFHKALEEMGVAAENTLYVGNDMHRDIHGARRVGMKTVMFNSDQGKKEYKGVKADYVINDYRELARILA